MCRQVQYPFRKSVQYASVCIALIRSYDLQCILTYRMEVRGSNDIQLMLTESIYRNHVFLSKELETSQSVLSFISTRITFLYPFRQ